MQLAECLWKARQSIVTQIEHTQSLQLTNLLREFGEIVIGKDQRLQIRVVPNPVRNRAELLLPKVEVRSRGIGHAGMLTQKLNWASYGLGMAKRGAKLHAPRLRLTARSEQRVSSADQS